MRRFTLLCCSALALIIGLGAAPAHAQQDKDPLVDPATSCTRLIAPLQRRLKEAGPRLEGVKDTKVREAEQSRLLFDILSDETTQKAIALTLNCLAAERR